MAEHVLPENKNSTIDDAKQQLSRLAKQRGLAALLDNSVKAKHNLAERTQLRIQSERLQQQQNLERIFFYADRLALSDQAASEPDADWMSSFLKLAADTQVKAMQELWANILSQEIAQPGSYSIKALETLKQMTQREATWFQSACELSVQIGSEINRKIITGLLRPSGRLGLVRARLDKFNLGQFRLPYHHILQLNELGLIYSKEMEIRPHPQRETELELSEQNLKLKPLHAGERILYYRFTPVGDELAKLLSPKPEMQYQQQLKQALEEHYAW